MNTTERQHAERKLLLGGQFPFDASDKFWTMVTMIRPPADDWSVRAARGVIADLCDRSGVKGAFQNIDEEIRIEMVQTLARIIQLSATGLIEEKKRYEGALKSIAKGKNYTEQDHINIAKKALQL